MNNLLTKTDSYKVSHWKQYPPYTTVVQSYIEARWSEEFPAIDKTLFFGLQAFLKQIEGKQFGQSDIDSMELLMKAHGEPFNKKGWQHILDKHKGRLPISIRAVPEGVQVPISNVLLTIQNTDPECFWLTSYLETSLLRAVWYPTTVASLSRHCKNIIGHWLKKTGNCSSLPFKLHDFGARGVSSSESAAIGGAAHLVNFIGTDTIECLGWLKKYYGAHMPGFSIPAAEHSTITTWGGPECEKDSFANMLDQFLHNNRLVAVVSDSYDIHEACRTWGTVFRDRIMNSGGTLVVRPDSGDPVQVTLDVVKLLDKYFGSETNDKGFKVLHPSVRILQGDGVDPSSIKRILSNYAGEGYSAENIAFGMGGALLQKVNRDTFGWAMKASAIKGCWNGNACAEQFWHPVSKRPKTMSSKNSKPGALDLLYSPSENRFITINAANRRYGLKNWNSVLREVFRDGNLLIEDTLRDIRVRSEGRQK